MYPQDCQEACDPMIAKASVARDLASGTATQLRARSQTIGQEKAAIEGVIDMQDMSLNHLSDAVDELFNKFMPVLANEDAIREPDSPEMPYYGSSQVFRRIQEQYHRTNNIAERVRLLRRVAEV